MLAQWSSNFAFAVNRKPTVRFVRLSRFSACQDARLLLVAWHDFQRDSALLNVNLDGKVSVLVRSSNPEVFYGIPSPNGRLLAITEAPSTQNVWQIENF